MSLWCAASTGPETKDVYGHLVAEDSSRAAEAMHRTLFGQ